MGVDGKKERKERKKERKKERGLSLVALSLRVSSVLLKEEMKLLIHNIHPKSYRITVVRRRLVVLLRGKPNTVRRLPSRERRTERRGRGQPMLPCEDS